MTWWIIRVALVAAAILFILEFPAPAGTAALESASYEAETTNPIRPMIVSQGFDTRSSYPCLTCD